MDRAEKVTRRLLAAAAATAAAAGLVTAGLHWASVQGRADTDRTAAQIARAHAALLASELQKFRLLPLVLEEFPDAALALRGGDAAAAGRLDRALELLQARTDAAVIYVVAGDGRTVSASNWRTPASFVGQNYAFRPYFRDAMRRGASELFALGTVSGRPGLYLARRVERNGRALGVVVVKVEFDRVEAAWARDAGTSIVTDDSGVILVTSTPAWRFRTTGALDPRTIAAARRTRQFGIAAPLPAPVQIAGMDAVMRGAGRPVRLRVARARAPLAGAVLVHLEPLAPALAAARVQLLLLAMGLLLAAVILAALLARAAEKRRLAWAAQVALEEEVARRTAELRRANGRLEEESRERVEADRRYRAAREDLAQANRLGSIGQITAGVAHEIAQPVAAIRAFAENGATFLDRGTPAATRENLSRIVQLTERIGRITAELRAYARRQPPAIAATTLHDAVAGTLLLLGEQTRGRLEVAMTPADARVAVTADRIRVEQVLINLVQNALDAIAEDPAGNVTLAVDVAADRVFVRVADSGPGVDTRIAETLFTPFASAKPEGLGLGLAIARDIARVSGGELRLLSGVPTTFELELPRA